MLLGGCKQTTARRGQANGRPVAGGFESVPHLRLTAA